MLTKILFLLGLMAVASNPSPYFAALGLVGGAGMGCLLLVKGGVTFLSLVLFLVYLGGMMVVFSYCAALVAEPHPEAWGGSVVGGYLGMYSLVVGAFVFLGGEKKAYWAEGVEEVMFDWWGVAQVLNSGGWVLFFAGWGLLLALFAVFEIVGGCKGSVLRAV